MRIRSAFSPSSRYRNPCPSSVNHGANRPHGHTVPDRLPQIHQKHRQPLAALLHLLERGRSRHQEHQIRVLDPRDPDLLAVHDVAVAATHRYRLHLGRVGSGRRLRHGEGLQPQLAAGNLRQVVTALRLGAVPEEGAHDVQLGVAGRGIATRTVDLLQDDRRLGDPQPGSTKLLGNQRGQIPCLGQRANELLGVGLLGIELTPVAVRKPRAQFAHGGSQIGVQFGVRHEYFVGRPCTCLEPGHAPQAVSLVPTEPLADSLWNVRDEVLFDLPAARGV